MGDDLYLVRYQYRLNPSEADPSVRREHEHWFSRVVASGCLVMAGRINEVDLPSALLLLRCADETEARRVVAADPYVEQGYVDLSLNAFVARHLPRSELPPFEDGAPAPVEMEALVRSVLVAYCRGVDTPDHRLIRGVFHDDAVCEYGDFRGGRDDVVARAQAVQDEAGFVASRHFIANLAVVADRSGVDVESSFVSRRLQRIDDRFRIRTREGRYLDRFEARAGNWRIVHRRVVDDWVVEHPVDVLENASKLEGAGG